MYQSSFLYHEVTFFSRQTISHAPKVYHWVHTNFSEEGYAYFISLGIEPHDAIHLASTKVNALSFRKEAQKASAALTDQQAIQDEQLNYLRKQIEKLTSRGGWTDDLQHCIHNIAMAINSEQAWGNNVHEAEKIGRGERFVYTTAVEHAKELKRIEDEKMISEMCEKEFSLTHRLSDFESYENIPPPESNFCVIL